MLHCHKCEKENAESIKNKGYGYGYMGNNLQCQRHDIPKTQIPIKTTEPKKSLEKTFLLFN